MHQFFASMRLLSTQSIKDRTIETKHRLAELKQVLLYPNNTEPINDSIEKILNELPPDKPLPRKFLKGKTGVKQMITVDELQKENIKSEKILDQVDRVMKIKKLCSEQEKQVVVHKRLTAKKDNLQISPLKNAADDISDVKSVALSDLSRKSKAGANIDFELEVPEITEDQMEEGIVINPLWDAYKSITKD